MHPDGQHGDRGPRPSSWTSRALGAGGRALGTAGHVLSSAEQRGGSHLGSAHLGTEALVAYVDGELGMGAHQRAAAHLALCTECAGDVQAQLQARSAVRAAVTPCTPAGLLGALRQIPEVQPPPAPPPDPAVRGAVVLDADGAWVSVLRPERFGAVAPAAPGSPAPRRRGFPLVVLTVSALAVGVLVAAPSATEAPVAGTGAAPVHTARLPGPTPSTTGTVVVGVSGPPQTATSPSAGQAVPAGARAQV